MSRPAARIFALSAMAILLMVSSASLLSTTQAVARAGGDNHELEARIVHLLNRAGYGPRPGDVERVRLKGLSRYIEEQLHPGQIDDAATDRRLSQFDTLHADAAVLWRTYSRNPTPITGPPPSRAATVDPSRTSGGR